jgi:hypothetical protein
MKEQMSDNEAVTDDAAAAAFVENFAIKIFGQADEEDRNGKSSRCVPFSQLRPGIGTDGLHIG